MSPLGSPNLSAMAPAAVSPQPDRAPDSLAGGTPEALRSDLTALLGLDRVLARPIDLIRYATDASPYRLFPKVVVVAQDTDDVRKVLAYAGQRHESVTFRAAGTSLSGQAQGDGILVDVRRHWSGVEVEAGGRRLRARPGTILSRGNAALVPYGYRIGPDPASASACTIGGVIANNSSGMCCGTTQNSYKTLSSLTFMLPSGTTIDTSLPDAEQQFAAAEPALAAGLLEIKRTIESDPDLVARLRKKFSIKNTTGYHMEAFLDGATPCEIFRRLIVGSEGTLAFIVEAVFDTIPDDQFRLTSFMIFADMYEACAAVKPFVDSGAAAVELLDRASLRAVEGKPGVPDRWKALPDTATALLVEYRAPSEVARTEALRIGTETLSGLRLLEPAAFTKDPKVAAQFWNVRSGLLPSVGGARPPGSSFILEDVCFPPERLADGALDLAALFAKHAYAGVVFGHASAGNLHFLITPFLNDAKDIANFGRFMEDVVELVVGKYDGSLKAEHGTGRNVAPFVEREWGPKLTGLMRDLKRLADPQNILSPGVLLTDDPDSHLKHLQTAPVIEATIDRCIQCGFCEPVCPSRNLTTTPRQRIALRREMARQPESSPLLAAILADYDYDAIQTCAGDGSCEIACPVDINTGAFIKHLRHLGHGPRVGSRCGERGASLRQGGARCTARRRHGRRDRARGRPWCSQDAHPRRPRRRQQGADTRLVDQHAACGNQPAGNPARRRCRGLLHGLRQPYLWSRRGSANAVAAGGDGRSVGARGHAAVDPGRHRRPLLRDDLALEGLRRRQRDHGEPCRGEPLALVERGEAADRLRRQLVLVRNCQRDRTVPRSGESRAPCSTHDSRFGRVGARSAVAEAFHTAQGRRGSRPPQLLGDSPRSRRKAARARRRARRQGGHAGVGRMLRLCR